MIKILANELLSEIRQSKWKEYYIKKQKKVKISFHFLKYFEGQIFILSQILPVFCQSKSLPTEKTQPEVRIQNLRHPTDKFFYKERLESGTK